MEENIRITIISIVLLIMLSACAPGLSVENITVNEVENVDLIPETENHSSETENTCDEKEIEPQEISEAVCTISDVGEQAGGSVYELLEEQVPAVTNMQDIVLPLDFEIMVYQGKELLGGEILPLSEILQNSDKPVVLNFWAGLCPLCRTELPYLQSIYEKYGDKVLVLAIDVGAFVGKGSMQDGINMLESLNVSLPAGSTDNREVLASYRVLGTPTTVFLTSSGEIHDSWTGVLSEEQLSSYVESLLE